MAAAVLLAVAAGLASFLAVRKPLPELSRSEFLIEVRSGHVRKVTIQDRKTMIGVDTTRGAFRTPFSRNDTALILELRARGIEIAVQPHLRD